QRRGARQRRRRPNRVRLHAPDPDPVALLPACLDRGTRRLRSRDLAMRRLPFLVLALVLLACPTDVPIENNAPQLSLDVGSTLEYVVGEGVIRIMVTAHDPDGGAV